VTFIEKGAKISLQTHNENLKSFISQIISVKSQWLRIFSVPKSVPNQSRGKIALWNGFHCEISRISNFQMWVWEVIFVSFSGKVTCTDEVFFDISSKENKNESLNNRIFQKFLKPNHSVKYEMFVFYWVQIWYFEQYWSRNS
jgi:hypothetical protein